jgi:hypothetical protein
MLRRGCILKDAATIVALLALLLLTFIPGTKAETLFLPTSPKNVAKDPEFVRCMSEERCGLEDRCSFKLKGDGRHLDPQGGGRNDTHVTISGHLAALKNDMSYPVVFFWDVMGYEVPRGHKDDERYHGVYCEAKTVNYVDTEKREPHKVRLYTSKIGNDPSLIVPGTIKSSDLEFMQILDAEDVECTRFQACRLLDRACDSAPEEDEACKNYKYVCNSYGDADQLAKEACIPECVSAYWPDALPEDADVDGEGVMACIIKGCGVRGSGMDGFYKTSTVVGLSVVLFLSLLLNGMFVFVACKFWRSSGSGGILGGGDDEGGVFGGGGMFAHSDSGYF